MILSNLAIPRPLGVLCLQQDGLFEVLAHAAKDETNFISHC